LIKMQKMMKKLRKMKMMSVFLQPHPVRQRRKKSKIPQEAEIVDLTGDDDEEPNFGPQQYRILLTFKEPLGKQQLTTSYAALRNIRSNVQLVILEVEKPENIIEFDKQMEKFLTHSCKRLDNRNKWPQKKKRDRIMSNLVKDAAEAKKKDFNFGKCPNGCGAEDRSFRMTIHTTLHCPLREKVCRYCKTSLLAKEINDHLKDCESLPLPCKNKCSARKIKRSQMEDHLAKHCPLTLCPCEYADFGCTMQIPRNQLAQHCQRRVDSHLSFVLRSHRQLKTQKDRLEAKLELTHTFLSSKFDDFPPEMAEPLDEEGSNEDVIEKDDSVDQIHVKLDTEVTEQMEVEQKPMSEVPPTETVEIRADEKGKTIMTTITES